MKIFKQLKTSRKGKVFFFFIGIGSLLWFLIRVIPKPSRAAYPCMRATAPFMSAFVIYLSALVVAFIVAARKNKNILQSRLIVASVFVAIAFLSFKDSSTKSAFAIVEKSSFVANQPIGIAKGIYPGRVVWVYNPNATNKNMTNSEDDYWFMDKNCDQNVVEVMLEKSIKNLAGKETLAEAWDALFKYFNTMHGKGNVGYLKGEKVAVKINLTTSVGMSNTSDKTFPPKENMDLSPQLALAMIKQLVEVVGVAQNDIYFGDPYQVFRDEYWDKCANEYPGVHYLDDLGINGREQTVPTDGQVLQFSNGQVTSSLPSHIYNAAYLINMANLKSHDVAGITLCAKNHQGSVLKSGDSPKTQSAMYLHPYLPGSNPADKQYRHLVDYMGHAKLGGNTLLYLVDGLWAGNNWMGIVEQWQMAPFNNDYPSSIFVSQDAVAIESVCFDFLLEEYSDRDAFEQFPYIEGVEDYLKQAADKSFWPNDIVYKSNGKDSIGSLGVYEHWNNADEKKYSRNLGTGNGIELISIRDETDNISSFTMQANYELFPNPFSETINLRMKSTGKFTMNIYDMNGRIVWQKLFTNSISWNGVYANGTKAIPGIYLVKVMGNNDNKLLVMQKIVLKN